MISSIVPLAITNGPFDKSSSSQNKERRFAIINPSNIVILFDATLGKIFSIVQNETEKVLVVKVTLSNDKKAYYGF
uniref:MSP domain-containing protein n=1 Tax=Heterorhabditis bacteriophora TaxID=37862 RepID=A0A1I7X9G9_HETBA